MLKIAVFGPRNALFNDVMMPLRYYFTTKVEKPVTIITSKKTGGWDGWARDLANEMEGVELWTMEAYWDTYKGGAGPIRNRLMAEECDFGVTGTECGNTPGTRNMLDELKRLGKKVVRI